MADNQPSDLPDSGDSMGSTEPKQLPEELLADLQRAAQSQRHLAPDGDRPSTKVKLLKEWKGELTPPLTQPLAVAIDPDRNILVLDRPSAGAFRLARFCPDSGRSDVVAIFAKGSEDTELLDPAAVVVDQECQLYVPDTEDGSVKKYSPDGRWLETYRSAGPAGTRFEHPRDVAVDNQGNLLVADTHNNRIVKLSPDGELVWNLQQFSNETEGTPDDEFFEPNSVCVGHHGQVHVADTNQNRVLTFDADSKLIATIQSADLFHFPLKVRLSRDDESLYVADRGNLRIQRFDANGKRTGILSMEKGGGESGVPGAGGDVEIDADSNVVMIDLLRESIVVLALPES